MADKYDAGALLAHRRFLSECRFAGSGERDRTILTIAGGSLAVSVAFLERVVPVTGPTAALLLWCAWGFEITAMLLVLWSHQTSEAALNAEIHRVDAMITCRNGDPGWPNEQANQTGRLNDWAAVATVVGLVLMLAHAGVSLYAFGGMK